VSMSTDYASFLVRLWREPRLALPEAGADWQGELEHIQSGRRSTSDSLDGLLDLLRRQVTALVSGRPPHE
jgi:hypothetical protein